LHGRMRGSPRWLLAALLLGVLSLLPSPAQGQSLGSVAGRVLAADGPLLAGAVVRLSGDGVSRAVLSDSAGQYLLAGLPPGTYLLSAARLGYRLTPTTIQVLSGISLRHDLVMDPVTVEVEGVVIEAPGEIDRERDRFDTEAGLTARVIRGDALKSLPGLAEADVLRAIEVLPGVVTTSDFSSAFNVRGGS